MPGGPAETGVSTATLPCGCVVACDAAGPLWVMRPCPGYPGDYEAHDLVEETRHWRESADLTRNRKNRKRAGERAARRRGRAD